MSCHADGERGGQGKKGGGAPLATQKPTHNIYKTQPPVPPCIHGGVCGTRARVCETGEKQLL